MHLYELATSYKSLEAWLSSDEPIDETALRQQLADITTQLKDKAENIGKMILDLEAESDTAKKEIDRLSKRKSSADNKATWLKSYLLEQMQVVSIDKLPCDLFTISLAKNPISVKIIDETKIAPEFWRTIPETKEVNKTAILTSFKETEGVIPDGVEIITDRKHLVIE
jgi:hypothetical protein